MESTLSNSVFAQKCKAIATFMVAGSVFTVTLYLVTGLSHIHNFISSGWRFDTAVLALMLGAGSVCAILSSLMFVGNARGRAVLLDISKWYLKYGNPAGPVLGVIWLVKNRQLLSEL